jgi:hypothetical protein
MKASISATFITGSGTLDFATVNAPPPYRPDNRNPPPVVRQIDCPTDRDKNTKNT